MGSAFLLRPSDRSEWLNVLERVRACDFYHLPQYHESAQDRGEGLAHLFVYEEADFTFALPLLFRPLEDVDCLKGDEEHCLDATSVYGYAGPLASRMDDLEDVRP